MVPPRNMSASPSPGSLDSQLTAQYTLARQSP